MTVRHQSSGLMASFSLIWGVFTVADVSKFMPGSGVCSATVENGEHRDGIEGQHKDVDCGLGQEYDLSITGPLKAIYRWEGRGDGDG